LPRTAQLRRGVGNKPLPRRCGFAGGGFHSIILV
jgi:hypothetical protein